VANADVRDDTIKRFAATRIASTLRMRLAMTDTEGAPESDLAVNESVNAGAALNHEFEAMARKLIMCWANNPALTLLLRVGLDLFPHPRLIVPVLEALESKLYTPAKKDSRTTRQEVLVAEYVAADLLRAGATETGHREDAAYPDSADITRYRQQLSSFARRLLLERGDRSPWYLKQQAMLYLASVGDHSVATTQAAVGCDHSGSRPGELPDTASGTTVFAVQGERLRESAPARTGWPATGASARPLCSMADRKPASDKVAGRYQTLCTCCRPEST